MAELFAALDSIGTVRFVDEVPRGAACGCRCPECSSPLVAKQGDAKAWHFAHEGGQERPECAVGAANLLRRVAIGLLRSDDALELPPFWRRLGIVRGGRSWTRTVELGSQRSAAWTWIDSPAQHKPAAHSTLSDGVPVELHVEVDQPVSSGAADVAVAVFVLALPPLEQLQGRLAAEQYVRSTGSVVWRHRPDRSGEFERASAELEHEAEKAAATAEAERVRLEQSAADHQASLTTSVTRFTPRRAASTALILYRLSNGTSWLVYTLDDGEAGLVQWPPDQATVLKPPAEVATFDDLLGVYRTTANRAIMFLAPQSKGGVRTDTSPAALAAWAAVHLAPQ